MKEHLKKSWVTLVTGLIFGIFLQILTGIPWGFIPSLLVFVVVLDIIIVEVNKNPDAKEAIKNLIYFFAGIIAFVGMRVIVGYLIDMPISDSYGQLGKSGGLMGVGWHRITASAIIVDMLFVLPGVMFSYLLVKGGKFWKGAMAMVCIALMVIVVWGVKQPTHAQAIKRYIQSFISLDANQRNNTALANEGAAASSFGIAKTRITSLYRYDAEVDNLLRDEELKSIVLPEGTSVLKTYPNSIGRIFEGENYTEVTLANPDGTFFGGTRVWVKSTLFDWVDGGKVIPNKSATISSKDGSVKKVAFDTNDFTVVLDNWAKNKTIVISGFGKDTVFFQDGNREAKVPKSGIITSNIDHPLEIKYKKGGILYINM